jgi:hypothetical protein
MFLVYALVPSWRGSRQIESAAAVPGQGA